MDYFFLPLPLLNPAVADGYHSHSFQQLEQYLDIAICLLRQTAERLRTALGADALGPELNHFLDANDPLAQSELVSRLDSLLKQKNQAEAARLLRELLAVTWDQAFELYDCWPHWDQTKKLRCLQAAELRRLFAAVADGLYPAANAAGSPSQANRQR